MIAFAMSMLTLGAAQADTLGTMPAGSVVTPGTVTTTGPDGTTVRKTQTYSPAPAPVSGDSAPPVLRAGPQSITPPGFGATSMDAGAALDASPVAAPSFPRGQTPDTSEALTTLNAVPGRAAANIEMGSLGGVDASSAGLISNADGGLGTSMWQGATRADVDQYLSMMPVATASPVVNDLGQRLLLTSATPPEGQVSGTSLLAIRLDRLIASGRADLAAQLGRGTSADTSPPVAVARARAALALGDDASACGELNNLPAGNDPAHDEGDAFATRLAAFCQIRSGNSAAANVTLDLAREEAYDNPLFYSLAFEASDGLKLKTPAPKTLDALDVQFYALAKRPLPDGAARIVVPAVVKTLSEDTSLAPFLRIEVGERAASVGVIKGDALAKLYATATFKPDELDGAKAGLLPKDAVMRRALLFQAVHGEVLATDRADLMKQYLAQCDAVGRYAACVGALLPDLLTLEPSPALAAFAPVATRALLVGGDVVHARQWFAFVGTENERDRRELSALMLIADPNGIKPLSDQEAAAIAADLKSGVAATQNFAATEAMIYDGAAQVLPQIVLQALVEAPRSVGAPEQLLNQLHNAGLQGSVGEVVLFSLVAIGPGGPESADRQAVAQSISSLRAIHLDGEARRLALEALMGRSHAGRG